MIIPDINLLLYAHIKSFREHRLARQWWQDTLNGDHEVSLCPPVVFGFLRIATNPRIFVKPMAVATAVDVVDEWLGQPNCHLLVPGPRHLEIAFRLLRELGSAGSLTTDVQVAAYSLEYQSELHSNDTDFARFSGVHWVNPLA